MGNMKFDYDIAIIGAGPGGLFSAYELMKLRPELKIVVFEYGNPLEKRKCPIDGDKVKQCIHCKTCAIMNGFGGAGAYSDGKYNITNEFGGTLYEYIGREKAMELMNYVDKINLAHGGEGTKLYSTGDTPIKKLCLENGLHLLNASVRHLGTDINYKVLENLYQEMKDHVDFHFLTPVREIQRLDEEGNLIDEVSNGAFAEGRADKQKTDLSSGALAETETGTAAETGAAGYLAVTEKGNFTARKCIISVGRSGSKWMEKVCGDMKIPTHSNRVDIGVRVELPALIFKDITDELYESKIVYTTKKYQDRVRTFCMNPRGIVVNENTNGIITVNGHSYEDPALQTENTNFALLVSKHFTEPFKDSNGYGESIARLSNMLGGGVIVQRFGDLIRGQRSNEKRISKNFMQPTLKATPGDLSLVMPKRILDGIIEMIYALDKIAPGTAGDETLLYGVEVKFYNMEVELDHNLETLHKGLFVIGDGSGVTHSLSHASASGVHVARYLAENM
ncbi:MAG: FAD-dependent oxidoreductase [Eubacterium sp.]|nr:FAD-dependent oxidoreductase [Eubacterium sp.]